MGYLDAYITICMHHSIGAHGVVQWGYALTWYTAPCPSPLNDPFALSCVIPLMFLLFITMFF